MFEMYVRANSSTLISALTVTCRTNPVKVPGVIFRLCPLAWPTGLQGQVNPLASSENHCSKDSFRARRCRLPFEPFLSRLTKISWWGGRPLGNYRSCCLDEMSAIRRSEFFVRKSKWLGVGKGP